MNIDLMKASVPYLKAAHGLAIALVIGCTVVGYGFEMAQSLPEIDMTPISRRRFIEKAGMGTAIAGLVAGKQIGLGADPLGIPIGSQTYPERQMVADGKFVELLKNMYGAGIRQIELCSPGYAQFKSLADGKQTRKLVEDAGLKCLSSHFSINEFRHGGSRRRSSGRRPSA